MWLKTLFVAALLLIPSGARAYNFLYIHPTTGKPIGWGKGATIRYYLDPGKLGRLTNDQAHTLLKEAMKIWENASPNAAVPHFEFAGFLPEDVNGTNYQKYVSLFQCYTDDLASCPSDAQKNMQTVIVFDEDDSVLNNSVCKIGGCAAYGTASVFSGNSKNPGNITAGTLVLGVSAGDSGEKISAAVGLMVHELGHLLALAHPALNQQLFFDQPTGWEKLMPTMFFHLVSPQDTVSATLNPDDIAGISVLYPSDTFSQNTATIKGTVTKSDGTPMMHANVIARNTTDPLCEAYSMLSGRFCRHDFIAQSLCINEDGTTAGDGTFTLAGLPSGTYTLEVEEVADKQLAFTLAPGLVNEFIAGDAEFWNEGDRVNEANTLSSTITLTIGETKENVNIVLNRSMVTDDRIKYIPLSTFTAGPGTRCPETPTVDYAALIGLNENSGNQSSETTSGSLTSPGCSLISSL